MNDKSQMKSPRGTWVTDKNVLEVAIYNAVCHATIDCQREEEKWLNDRDQFLYPNDGWKADKEFQSDCLAYTLFSNSNNIKSSEGVNHWIPFSPDEAGAQDDFKSHFMHDYITGRLPKAQPSTQPVEQGFFGTSAAASGIDGHEAVVFSPEAAAVLDAARSLWRYYHKQPHANPDASYYDIRLHFQGTKTLPSGKQQMNADSTDERYTALLATLRQAVKALAGKIEPKVYEYGFLKA